MAFSQQQNVVEKVRKYLETVRVAHMYKIAKELGITYGAAQYAVARLERQGVVKSMKLGNKRYVFYGNIDLSAVAVGDVIKEYFSRIDPNTPLSLVNDEVVKEIAERLGLC